MHVFIAWLVSLFFVACSLANGSESHKVSTAVTSDIFPTPLAHTELATIRSALRDGHSKHALIGAHLLDPERSALSRSVDKNEEFQSSLRFLRSYMKSASMPRDDDRPWETHNGNPRHAVAGNFYFDTSGRVTSVELIARVDVAGIPENIARNQALLWYINQGVQALIRWEGPVDGPRSFSSRDREVSSDTFEGSNQGPMGQNQLPASTQTPLGHVRVLLLSYRVNPNDQSPRCGFPRGIHGGKQSSIVTLLVEKENVREVNGGLQLYHRSEELVQHVASGKPLSTPSHPFAVLNIGQTDTLGSPDAGFAFVDNPDPNNVARGTLHDFQGIEAVDPTKPAYRNVALIVPTDQASTGQVVGDPTRVGNDGQRSK